MPSLSSGSDQPRQRRAGAARAERRVSGIQAPQERKMWVTHKRQGPLRQGTRVLEGWGPLEFQVGPPWRPLAIGRVAGNCGHVNLVVLNIIFPPFCIKNGVRAPSRHWYKVGPRPGDPNYHREVADCWCTRCWSPADSSIPTSVCEAWP